MASVNTSSIGRRCLPPLPSTPPIAADTASSGCRLRQPPSPPPAVIAVVSNGHRHPSGSGRLRTSTDSHPSPPRNAVDSSSLPCSVTDSSPPRTTADRNEEAFLPPSHFPCRRRRRLPTATSSPLASCALRSPPRGVATGRTQRPFALTYTTDLPLPTLPRLSTLLGRLSPPTPPALPPPASIDASSSRITPPQPPQRPSPTPLAGVNTSSIDRRCLPPLPPTPPVAANITSSGCCLQQPPSPPPAVTAAVSRGRRHPLGSRRLRTICLLRPSSRDEVSTIKPCCVLLFILLSCL
ncbi:formin-like protein 20 [Zingiber officinale]|uniref:formin-like protein 20 n=1 Tax=Zingiber officinale TaxID=94328 RepID=UPI001C4C625C|nr:formin-like protein 20 [Zingiber officinale]